MPWLSWSFSFCLNTTQQRKIKHTLVRNKINTELIKLVQTNNNMNVPLSTYHVSTIMDIFLKKHAYQNEQLDSLLSTSADLPELDISIRLLVHAQSWNLQTERCKHWEASNYYSKLRSEKSAEVIKKRERKRLRYQSFHSIYYYND